MIRDSRSKGRNAAGATMVEMMLITILFFGTVGAFFVFGIAYYRYGILVNATTSALRRLTVDTGGGTYSDLEKKIPDEVSSYIKDTYGIDPVTHQIKFTNANVCNYQGKYCKASVDAAWPIPCFFCFFLAKENHINIHAEVNIEDPCFADTSLTGPCGSSPWCP